ncbi:uncharacterized protein TA04480 [Theileria annulata]|uniref:Uncharacterized protein n=1 Tax=Theileria annulata TaxID=5874 RepID=Q4UCW6_THEAN|nr:uncharacterized protein TA04480 [Theileria annulata]CAI75335.1 hypothetical protein TA04480 [Theileria annulata]|eukprot:XP_954811.1 hypothetical protein TA04480 [Theileria annulata]
MTGLGLPYKSELNSNIFNKSDFLEKKQFFEQISLNNNKLNNIKQYNKINNLNKFKESNIIQDSNNIVQSSNKLQESNKDYYTSNNFYLNKLNENNLNNIKDIDEKNLNEIENVVDEILNIKKNLNVVRRNSIERIEKNRLPIMYQDDVEALLTRQPNSVRNFINSLNSQFNTFFNSTVTVSDTVLAHTDSSSTNTNNLTTTNTNNLTSTNNTTKDPTGPSTVTEGKRANFTAMECTSGKGANFTGMECINTNSTKDSNTKGTLSGTKEIPFGTVAGTQGFVVGPSTVTDVTEELTYRNEIDNYKSINMFNPFYINEPFEYHLTCRTHFTNTNTMDEDTSEENTNEIAVVTNSRESNTFSTGVTGTGTRVSSGTEGGVGFHGPDTVTEVEKTIFDRIFNKSFLQSFNTLPEGVNLIIDTPTNNITTTSTDPGTVTKETPFGSAVGASTVTEINMNIDINNLFIINSGWVWLQSTKTKDWLPKFIILFYTHINSTTTGKGANFTAMECTTGKGANFTAMECTMGKGANSMVTECTMGNKDTNTGFNNTKGVEGEESFWNIYNVYIKLNPNLNNLTLINTDPKITTDYSNGSVDYTIGSSDTLGSPDYMIGSPDSITGSTDMLGYYNKLDEKIELIKNNSRIYLCIMNYEPENYYESILNRKYIQLYRVDEKTPPSLRSFNKCWLSRLIAQNRLINSRSLLNYNLQLITISLDDNYECSFIPLCAAKLNNNIKFNLQMQLALKNQIEQEYNNWIFKLWEYTLRINQSNYSNGSISNGNLTNGNVTSVNLTNGNVTSGNLTTVNGVNSVGGVTGVMGEKILKNIKLDDIEIYNMNEICEEKEENIFTRVYKYIYNFFVGNNTIEDTNEPIYDNSKFRTYPNFISYGVWSSSSS